LTSQFYEIDSESTTQEKLMLPQEVWYSVKKTKSYNTESSLQDFEPREVVCSYLTQNEAHTFSKCVICDSALMLVCWWCKSSIER
jgi:hypothetical protein